MTVKKNIFIDFKINAFIASCSEFKNKLLPTIIYKSYLHLLKIDIKNNML